MNRTILTALAGSILLVGAVTAATANATPPHQASARHSVRVCATAPAGYAACQAKVVVDGTGKPLATSGPSGLNPADIRSAYNLTTANSTATVAIIDAYDDPTAEADLGVYRSKFGLPACTTGNGCFRKVNQTGGSTPPRADAGWATEITLDLDMVSATCPGCHILLVEASSNSFANLGAAVNYAAGIPGVVAISNSYGGSDSATSSAYNHPGIAVTASTGDAGYGMESPASFNSVVAVGGTSLKKSSTPRGWTESAWSGAGSGCGTINATTVQKANLTQCGKKANADVSAVADPQTGVSIYDSTRYQGRAGWQVYGGTSASSPIIASVYAMSGNTAGYPASVAWNATSGLNDVTSGSNGSCSPALWCTAGSGWDGPTGLGTPNGTTAF
jgi:subtilase family serine protease